jgi:hypothetical protein
MIVVNVAIWISILHMYGYLLPEPVRFVSESIALYIGIPIATIAALAYLRGDSLPSTFYDITHTLFGSPTLVLLFGFFVLYMAREPLTTVAGSFITSLPPIVQTYVPETWALLLPAWGGLWYYGLYR